MLEGIVQDGHVGSSLRRQRNAPESLGVHNHHGTRIPGAVQPYLVRPVTPGDESRTTTHLLETRNEPAREGCLSRPSHGQIAYRDHRDWRLGGGQNCQIVSPVSEADHSPIEKLHGEEHGTHGPTQDPCFSTPNPPQPRPETPHESTVSPTRSDKSARACVTVRTVSSISASAASLAM